MTRSFSLCCAAQAIQRVCENPERTGQVGPVPVGVGGRQLPPDLHRLLGHRQRLGRAAQLREPDVARYLNGHPLTDDAVLIVSELATNAVLYSGSAGRSFTVRAELFAGYLWLEVEDLAGVEWERKPGDGTHGLDIVTALCGEWELEETGDGTRVVWARLELP
jgi:hypothetical protein